MFTLLAVVSFLLCFVPDVQPAQPLKLPSYLKRCSLSDPNFNACAVKSARDGLPYYINGDRKYRMPSLNPLEVTEITVKHGTDSIGLQIHLKTAKLWGLNQTNIRAIESDIKNRKFKWILETPRVEVLANYNVSGKVLLLPIFGAGKANVTLINPKYTYDWKYTTVMRNGLEWLVPQKGVIGYELDQVYINLENLFNGDKLLGPQMNKFLNENWQDAARELGPTLAEALAQVIDSMVKTIAETVPYKDIFLP